MNVPGHAGGQPDGHEVRPVEGIHRVVVLDPLVAAERAARKFQLEEVVEHAPRAEDLPLAVAAHVIGGADTGRELVLITELDTELRNVGAGGVGRHLLLLGADTDVHRQLVVQRPGVLDEEPHVVHVDVALGDEAAGRVGCLAADRVIAVRSPDISGPRRATAPGPSQAQSHARPQFASQHLVARAVELHTELDLVLTAGRARTACHRRGGTRG